MSKPDEYNRNELHYLCIDLPKERRIAAMNEIIKNGGDVNAVDINGWTPLHFAAQEDDFEVAEALIKEGADIKIRDKNGNTPLWVATMNANEKNIVIDLFLSNGANPKEPNDHGVSPVDISPEYYK